MLINKTAIFLSTILSLVASFQFLNTHKAVNKNEIKNQPQNKEKIDISQPSSARQVAEFESKKQNLASKNPFQNIQNKNLRLNSQVYLSNKASYNYQVSYSNYRTDHRKGNDFNINVTKNTTNRMINIGENLLAKVTVRVSAPGQKWANLVITKQFVPSNSIIPSSIHYAIFGSKKINDASVLLNVVYKNRTNPQKLNTTNIGHFNVKNITKNTLAFLSTNTGIIVASLGVIVLAAIAGGGFLLALYKRSKNIQNTIENKLSSFLEIDANGAPKSAFFGEGFESETQLLLEKANSLVRNTFAADEFLVTRNYFISEGSRLRSLVLDDEALVENSAPNINTESLTGDTAKTSTEAEARNAIRRTDSQSLTRGNVEAGTQNQTAAEAQQQRQLTTVLRRHRDYEPLYSILKSNLYDYSSLDEIKIDIPTMQQKVLSSRKITSQLKEVLTHLARVEKRFNV